MTTNTRATWREKASQRISEILDRTPGRQFGLRNLKADPIGAAEKHDDIMYKNIILNHCQALLEMPGTREERSTRVTDYLICNDVLKEPISNVGEWRAARFLYFRNLGYDSLQAIWAVAEQEGPGTSREAVLQSLRRFKTKGGQFRGWDDEDFSELPGLSAERLRAPESRPDFHQQDK